METTPETEILLVGNARSLLERRDLGKRIDSFPVVVRFNNFVTAGYEAFVGRKTDWWARNETGDVQPRQERFARILLRLQGEIADVYHRGGTLLVPELERQHPEAAIEVIPRSIFTELIEAYGFRNAPLTGTLVIAYLLKTYPRVHVCGMDNLSGTPDTLRHYYSDGNIIGDWTRYHEPDKEQAYLNGQIRHNRVIPL